MIQAFAQVRAEIEVQGQRIVSDESTPLDVKFNLVVCLAPAKFGVVSSCAHDRAKLLDALEECILAGRYSGDSVVVTLSLVSASLYFLGVYSEDQRLKDEGYGDEKDQQVRELTRQESV